MPKFRMTSWNLVDAIEAYPSEHKCRISKHLHNMDSLCEKYEKKMIRAKSCGNRDLVLKYWERLKLLKIQLLALFDWTDYLNRTKTEV